jgi:hypothetical protein
MSVFGTGPAAGVAAAALSAQQTARSKDREKTASARESKRLRELMEAHLLALEEGDESDTPTQLHIDNHLPEHHTPPTQRGRGMVIDRITTDTSPSENDDPDDAPAPGNAPGDEPLYRHLDVQA